MTFFVVLRGHGPHWDDARGMREQDGWSEHAQFMDDLTGDGLVMLGGPLGQDASRILLVVEAVDDGDVRSRLGQDPWHRTGHLELTSVEPWQILLDRRQVPGARTSAGASPSPKGKDGATSARPG